MSEKKWTPGEWEYIGTEVWQEDTDNESLAMLNLEWGDERAAANGHLMAASKKLYDALEAVEWFATPALDMGRAFLWLCPWCNAQKAAGHGDDCTRQLALAKARGESE